MCVHLEAEIMSLKGGRGQIIQERPSITQWERENH